MGTAPKSDGPSHIGLAIAALVIGACAVAYLLGYSPFN